MLESIRTSVLLNRIINHLGFVKEILIRILYWRYRVFPTEKIKTSKDFFEKNRVEIEKNISFLSDNESIEIYKKMIAFRSTYDLRLHPDYDVESQYFISGITDLSATEVFCDCGGYIGDTIDKIYEHVEHVERIVTFEPDPKNLDVIRKKYESNPEVKIINTGVWSSEGILNFINNKNGASRIVQDDNNMEEVITIPVSTIDSIPELEKVSFIKMDVEGAEMEALKGARNRILERKPKLAISIYHSDEDMIRIIQWIHELVPEYRMYIRQHSHSFFDTVLYCVL